MQINTVQATFYGERKLKLGKFSVSIDACINSKVREPQRFLEMHNTMGILRSSRKLGGERGMVSELTDLSTGSRKTRRAASCARWLRRITDQELARLSARLNTASKEKAHV